MVDKHDVATKLIAQLTQSIYLERFQISLSPNNYFLDEYLHCVVLANELLHVFGFVLCTTTTNLFKRKWKTFNAEKSSRHRRKTHHDHYCVTELFRRPIPMSILSVELLRIVKMMFTV